MPDQQGSFGSSSTPPNRGFGGDPVGDGSGDPFGPYPGSLPPTAGRPSWEQPPPPSYPPPRYPTSPYPTVGYGDGADAVFGPPSGGPLVAGGSAVGNAPVRWLFAALALATVAAVVAFFLGGMLPVAAACWLAAGPVAVGLLAIYFLLDTKQQARGTHVAPTWTKRLYIAAIVMAVLGVAISAFWLALWASEW